MDATHRIRPLRVVLRQPCPSNRFPIGRRIDLPGHFAEPVVLESVRALGRRV